MEIKLGEFNLKTLPSYNLAYSPWYVDENEIISLFGYETLIPVFTRIWLSNLGEYGNMELCILVTI